MDEILKTQLLLNSVGADVRHWKKIVSSGINLCQILKDDYERLKITGLTERAVAHIRENDIARWAESEFERASTLGVDIVSCDDINYPANLLDLKDPPLLLYWHGNMKSISYSAVGVVGTRKCSSYGRETAEKIGAFCAAAHRILISGGAAGIDGFAHGGAGGHQGETVAVLGNGVDVVFPSSNRLLFEKIKECGALISEFPLGSGGEAWRFPKRNRIVAALSDKLIVAEAPLKSGAMITAKIALELGREVWAVPGRINEAVSEGSNRLIFDGAFPYISHGLFFDFCDKSDGQSSLFSNAAPLNSADDLTQDERSVMKILWRSGSQTVDNLAVEVKMSAADVMKILAILSAKGYTYSSGPGRFSAKA